MPSVQREINTVRKKSYGEVSYLTRNAATDHMMVWNEVQHQQEEALIKKIRW